MWTGVEVAGLAVGSKNRLGQLVPGARLPESLLAKRRSNALEKDVRDVFRLPEREGLPLDLPQPPGSFVAELAEPEIRDL